MTPSNEQAETMLDAAGLTPSDEAERKSIAERYGPLREGIEKLYDLPEGRYEDFGLTFEAEPALADWRAEQG